jgi:hypothetical protein
MGSSALRSKGRAPGSDPRGVGEPHILEVRARGAALDAAEAAQGMTTRLMMLTNDAA